MMMKKQTVYVISVCMYERESGSKCCSLNMISSGRQGLKESGFYVK